MALKIFRKAMQIFSGQSEKRLRTAPRAFSASKCKTESTRADLEKVTHTGQVFAKDDYRNIRFLNAKRYVNEHFAIDMSHTVPPQVSTTRIVSCDGGGALGHPKFYINLDKPGIHYCYYCGNAYVKKPTAHQIHVVEWKQK